MKYVLGCLVSAVLGSLLSVWMLEPAEHSAAVAQGRSGPRGPVLPAPGNPRSVPPAVSPRDRPEPQLFDDTGLSAVEAINVSVYEKVNRGVVNITTKSVRGDGFFLLESSSEGSGSGSVIDRKGHILTNLHVIEDARTVSVTLFDGKTYEASFVGADAINDLAIIRIDAPPESLHPIAIGDSSRLRVGMQVFAIGNPFGLERTMTTGIISSLNRSLQLRGNRSIRSIIQTDAAVNPGNSGGPLIDARGRIIGINTAIATRTGQNSGIGFAIPSNLVGRVVPQLITHGRVIRPEIGIQRVYQTDDGLLIARMTPDGPAEQAGLRGPRMVRERRGPFVLERVDRSAADLIVGIDGRKVESADEFLGYIEEKQIGDTVQLKISRDGKEVIVNVTLGGSEPPSSSR